MERIVSVHDLFSAGRCRGSKLRGRTTMLTRKQFELLRFVHERLKERSGVETFSEGEEPERCVIVAPLVAD